MTPDPCYPTPSAARCGECGYPLWPVGTHLFCANLACSMYARESTDADKPRVVRSLHLQVVTHHPKPERVP